MIKSIKSFISVDNIFQQKAYQLEKPKVEKLLKDLESYSAGKTKTISPNNNFPLAPVIVIRNRRIRKQK